MPRHKNVGDDVLLNAVRQRILDEISAKQQSAAATVHNNVYGGGGHVPSAGIQEQMGGMDPELYDYIVNIERRDAAINPDTGKPGGWDKKVMRSRVPHTEGGGSPGPEKKKKRA